jgi:two-component system, NtrC family, nitrogen regulation sensor histidine kinase NtrY
MTVLALSVWLSHLSPMWLWVAALGSGVWSVSAVRSTDRARLFAAIALWLAVGVAAGVQHRLSRVINDWPALQLEVEERSADAAEEALNRLLDDGERAVAAAEAAAAAQAGAFTSAQLFGNLDDIQRATGVTAIVLFDESGVAVAWSGEHRGDVPDDARLGTDSYIFHEGPLFSYLYFVRPLPNGLTAAAAFLLEGSIEPEEGVVPFADSFQRQHGLRPRFWVPERAPPDAVWDWATDERPIFSVSFVALTQQSWWQRMAAGGRRGAGLAGLASMLILGAAWYRSRQRPAGLPALVGTVALLSAPLGALVEPSLLFSPLQFVLPGPLDITLGVLLVLVVGTSIWLLGWRRSGGGRLPLWLGVPLVGGVFILGVELVRRSASDSLLATRSAGGFALQLASALLIALPAFLVISNTRRPAVRPEKLILFRVAGYVLPAIMGLSIGAWWEPARPIPFAVAGAWVIPAVLLLIGHAQERRIGYPLRLWLAAGWLAGSLVLAFLWPMHVRAELTRAGRELAALGTRPDPFLDYLLRQFADHAQRLADDGEGGVNLLYQSWTESGLAREGYEARMSLWRQDEVEAELNLSEMPALPPRATADVLSSRAASVVLHYGGIEGLHYLLVAPLGADRTVSVAVPPRRRLAAATPLARFLYPDTGSPVGSRGETLYLVRVDSAADAVLHANVTVASDTVHWVRTSNGWRSETLVDMPEGPSHAHLLVNMSPVPLLLTRAVLVEVGILLALLAIWLAARVLGRDPTLLPLTQVRWFQSFRGRLSAALFFFFLLPTLVFGAVSYGAVAREVVRSAAALAQQALDQAAARLAGAPLSDIGESVRTDLLMYRQGTIEAATAPEVIELGLFHTWLPPDVYLRFSGGEDFQELEERRLADSDYLVAYRRIDGATVLAAPIPLASNEIQRRQQEFRDVALLVILLGLGLSVVLALLVSRALASPLDALTRAAVTVGGGNLRTRLPETRSDEFGNVYASFNRMVGRLRRTRAALVKETRRTETIVAEAATGVLALDDQGRIELINPRAAEILGGDCRRGDPLITDSMPVEAVPAAILELIEARSQEAGSEVEVDGRIIRIRLRRLAGEDGAGGAVVALEDVTAEVRTARVLAWGEMARQVAHEIKNPLTPIKLAVQHLRRAFVDQRSDFGAILEKNVEAILREIDRLGEISRAFSRFGTPGTAETPLEAVDIDRVITELLALYQGASNGATFRVIRPDQQLPAVVGRTDELKEVLINLLENAREAVASGGEVVVSVEVPDPTGPVVVTVSDTGVGIPENELPRIFDPHFSTRSSGTGLGLAIVRRIVDSWGGSIQAQSTVGVGTRMEIRLNMAPDTG